jgi:hypothetical protein
MHLCDFAFSAEGGKPCIIGIFEYITAKTVPVVQPVMFVAVQFRGTPHETVPFVIEVVRPNGTVIVHIDGATHASREGRAFIAAQLITVQFPEYGQYNVRVLSNGHPLASQSLRIQRPQSQPNPTRAH